MTIEVRARRNGEYLGFAVDQDSTWAIRVWAGDYTKSVDLHIHVDDMAQLHMELARMIDQQRKNRAATQRACVAKPGKKKPA